MASLMFVLEGLLCQDIPERDRVTERINSQNAVLPLGARWASQQIGGARFGRDVHTLPFIICLPAKAQHARSNKRDADNLSKHCFVPMPSNACAWRILRHQHVL